MWMMFFLSYMSQPENWKKWQWTDSKKSKKKKQIIIDDHLYENTPTVKRLPVLKTKTRLNWILFLCLVSATKYEYCVCVYACSLEICQSIIDVFNLNGFNNKIKTNETKQKKMIVHSISTTYIGWYARNTLKNKPSDVHQISNLNQTKIMPQIWYKNTVVRLLCAFLHNNQIASTKSLHTKSNHKKKNQNQNSICSIKPL